MKSNNGKALKAGVWYTLSNFLTRAIGFISMPIFTRLLSTSDVGDYSNFTSWLSILAIITSLDFCSSIAIARFDFKEKINDYIASILVFGTVITSLCYCIALCYKSELLKILSFNDFEFNVAFIFCMINPALEMFQIKSRIDYNYKTSAFLSFGNAVGGTLISILFVLFSKDKLFGRIAGYYVPIIVLDLIIYIYLLRKGKTLKFKYCKYALTISLPLVWHALASNLLGSSDRVMIKYFCGSDQVAYYSVAYSCALIVAVLWNSMNVAWSPWAYEKMDERDYAILKRVSKPYISFFMFVVFIFMLIAPEVLWVLGGESYMEAVNVIPPVMLGYVFQFIYSLYVNIEIYHKKQVMIALGTTIAAITNVMLNALLLPKFGYIAAAYTTLIGYVIMFLIHYWTVHKIHKTYWYDTKFNLLSLSIFSVIMFICPILYRFTALRFFVISLFSALIIFVLVKIKVGIIQAINTKSIKPVVGEFKRFIENNFGG